MEGYKPVEHLPEGVEEYRLVQASDLKIGNKVRYNGELAAIDEISDTTDGELRILFKDREPMLVEKTEEIEIAA